MIDNSTGILGPSWHIVKAESEKWPNSEEEAIGMLHSAHQDLERYGACRRRKSSARRDILRKLESLAKGCRSFIATPLERLGDVIDAYPEISMPKNESVRGAHEEAILMLRRCRERLREMAK
jgi:predicted ATP-dependent protease